MTKKKKEFDLISPLKNSESAFSFFDQLSDFPSSDELRKTAWPKIS